VYNRGGEKRRGSEEVEKMEYRKPEMTNRDRTKKVSLRTRSNDG
jgi:hypothetical protein